MNEFFTDKMAKISVAVLMGLGLLSTVNVSTLSDLSSGVFLTFYILTMVSAAALSGSLLATQIYYKKQKNLYHESQKKLKLFEEDNKFDIAFSSESIALYRELQDIDKKIHQLKKDK